MEKGNVVYIQNGLLSVTKKNKIMSFVAKWMELEDIMLGEISQM
jgi:hypothetical protein